MFLRCRRCRHVHGKNLSYNYAAGVSPLFGCSCGHASQTRDRLPHRPPTLGPGPRVTWWGRCVCEEFWCSNGALGHPPHPRGRGPAFTRTGAFGGNKEGQAFFRWSTASTLRTWLSSLPCVTLLRPGWRGNPRNPTHSDAWRCAQSWCPSEAQRTAGAAMGWMHLQGSTAHETLEVCIDPRSHSRARLRSRKPPLALVIPKSWQPQMNLLCFLSLSFLGFPINRI